MIRRIHTFLLCTAAALALVGYASTADLPRYQSNICEVHSGEMTIQVVDAEPGLGVYRLEHDQFPRGPIGPTYPTIRSDTPISEIKRWLKLHSIESEDGYGKTLLDEAARVGNAKLCRILIAKGARLEPRFPLELNSGRTVPTLFWAVGLGGDPDPETVRVIVSAGANVNRRVGDITPLLLVCSKGPAVKPPLKLPPNHSPIPSAEERQNLNRKIFRIVKLLLEHGADPNVYSDAIDTPSTDAKGRPELVNLLRKYGARDISDLEVRALRSLRAAYLEASLE